MYLRSEKAIHHTHIHSASYIECWLVRFKTGLRIEDTFQFFFNPIKA